MLFLTLSHPLCLSLYVFVWLYVLLLCVLLHQYRLFITPFWWIASTRWRTMVWIYCYYRFCWINPHRFIWPIYIFKSHINNLIDLFNFRLTHNFEHTFFICQFVFLHLYLIMSGIDYYFSFNFDYLFFWNLFTLFAFNLCADVNVCIVNVLDQLTGQTNKTENNIVCLSDECRTSTECIRCGSTKCVIERANIFKLSLCVVGIGFRLLCVLFHPYTIYVYVI